jgi:hypothetical protein
MAVTDHQEKRLSAFERANFKDIAQQRPRLAEINPREHLRGERRMRRGASTTTTSQTLVVRFEFLSEFVQDVDAGYKSPDSYDYVVQGEEMPPVLGSVVCLVGGPDMVFAHCHEGGRVEHGMKIVEVMEVVPDVLSFEPSFGQ